MATVNSANKKCWNRFGMVTRGTHDGAKIEFAACSVPAEANRRPLMNKPRWFSFATPTDMTKPAAAAYFMGNEALLAEFVRQMGENDGYAEEDVRKCLREVGEKSAKSAAPVLDLAALEAEYAARKAAEG